MVSSTSMAKSGAGSNLSSHSHIYSNGVFVLAIDQAGNLWLQGSTYRSVYYTHFQGHIPPATGLWRDAGDQAWPSPDWSVCGVWRSFTDGRRYSYLSLNQCVQQKAARAQIYDSLPARDRDLTSVVVDADRSIWWAYAKTLGHVSNSQSITLELPGTYAYSLAADPAHGVWIATGQGLAYSDGTTVQQPLLDLNSRTFHGTPLDIAVDTQSVVWVNLQENGEVKSYSVATPKWRHVMNDAVNVRGIRSIAAAPEGGFWATRGWDLWRSNDPIDLRPVNAAAPPCPLRRPARCATSSSIAMVTFGVHHVNAAHWNTFPSQINGFNTSPIRPSKP